MRMQSLVLTGFALHSMALPARWPHSALYFLINERRPRPGGAISEDNGRRRPSRAVDYGLASVAGCLASH
jgi:hypothetical protein